VTPGAKFCHRCGAPAGSTSSDTEQRSFATALPWAVAAIALVAVIALVAGQRFAARQPAADASAASPDRPGTDAAGAATPAGQPPDISQLTPAEAAVRLYNRVMAAHERGQQDTVQMFAPMAISAYQMIGQLNLDQHYDIGRIAAVSGDEAMARAQADTILAKNPNHLLGLILAADAAHIRKDAAAEQDYRKRLAAAASSERAKQLPEYVEHTNDIDAALSQTKR
jgi:hypothetical protein